MFLKSLTISSGGEAIREINFKKGINLIVDETSNADNKTTGNNVGKTTVLKLVDFCLGADSKIVYVDPESKKDTYVLVKDFLINNEVLITLILKEDLEILNSPEIIIERNFLSYKKKIQRINGDNLTEEEFELKLLQLIIPEFHEEKPTFRQIISHNIRYKDENINNTLKTLDKYTSDAEYEALYLFLFGCKYIGGNSKQVILEKLKQENNFKNRLEKQQTKTAYETALALIDSEIEDLNKQKSKFNLNENFEQDLDKLNGLKYEINRTGSEISKYTIRKDLINEAEREINSRKSEIDLQQLQSIYRQASDNISGIHKTFSDLVDYHNQMIVEKVKFIKKELPDLEDKLRREQTRLKKLLEEEKELSLAVTQSDSFEALEKIIVGLNERFKTKGEYENILRQLMEVDTNIKAYTVQLDRIDDELFSDSFEKKVQEQLNKFNRHFASISNRLYNEQYLIKFDIVKNKNNQRLYKFTAFNSNISSGKKQGEISCFDIAYTIFADEEKISCLHFLLNDKKELLCDNQLVKIAEFANINNIQFVASILKDKLPRELDNEEYFAIKLSQQDKLFRIENGKI